MEVLPHYQSNIIEIVWLYMHRYKLVFEGKTNGKSVNIRFHWVFLFDKIFGKNKLMKQSA